MLSDLSDVEKVMKQGAFDIIALISTRVQQEGKDQSGNKMTTKGQKKTGEYSFYYGREREKSGFQTDHVDLTVSGNLMNGFIFESNKDELIVGFNESASDQAEYSEAYYGSIFRLSDDELNTVIKAVEDNVNDIIRDNLQS